MFSFIFTFYSILLPFTHSFGDVKNMLHIFTSSKQNKLKLLKTKTMKNTTVTSKISNQELDSLMENKATKNAASSIAKYIQAMLLCLIMISFCSCQRNMASGCGTWPMANGGGHKINKSMYKSSAPSLKRDKQYAYYKRYN